MPAARACTVATAGCEDVRVSTRTTHEAAMPHPLPPFHLAIPVHDVAAARAFYGGLLGCAEGRSDTHWVDFDLYGHQLVCHHSDAARAFTPAAHNAVDGHDVPVPHFGVVLSPDDWNALASRQPGEQSTMFFHDPSGNAVEFKAFADPAQLFAR